MSDDPLTMPVQFLKGVGPVRAAQFETMGVRTVGELLEYLPFRYELKPKSKAIGHLVLSETSTVVGAVRKVRSSSGYRRSSLVVEVEDGTGRCRVRWFNTPYLRDKLCVGQIIRLTGRVETDDRQAVFVNPEFTIIPDNQDPFAADTDQYDPVYHATASLTSRQIAGAIGGTLERSANHIIDFLPPVLREKRSFPPRRTAIMRCHHPTSLADVPIARRRLAYDEFLLMQLAIRLRHRRTRETTGALRVATTPKIDDRIRKRLPFDLTKAQNRAVATIAADLDSDQAMMRLVQGDVGAGKTAVAVYAALTTIANRHQVVMLSPTEVLAEQTYRKFERYLDKSRVRIALLVGGTPRRSRNDVLARLAARELDLVVGTHALLEKDVWFGSLGLVIIDEQHRFGVAQRQALRSKGRCPHYLVMTATPIPRTLAMTMYGHLDVTVIDELPPGRQPIDTRLIDPDNAGACWTFVRDRLAAGEQAFVVYPLVEESETLDLKAAKVEFEKLRDGPLSGFETGLLHGRMSSEHKSEAIDAFRAGKTQALVTTTVIEVGVDVPNATIMVIEHAERYGLSQLHQMRGRIGRGTQPSTCILMSSANGPKSRERLAILCSTTDGFKIAEADLKLRGPGELIGTRQHGLPVFRAADLINDFDLLVQARDDAADLLRVDPDLARREHDALRREVQARYPNEQTIRMGGPGPLDLGNTMTSAGGYASASSTPPPPEEMGHPKEVGHP